MIALALAFVSGAWVLQHMPFLPDTRWLLVLAPVVLLVVLLTVFLARKFHQNSQLALLSRCIRILAAFAIGFMWAALFAHARLSDDLPKHWEGKDIQVVGVVASLPQKLERGERFEFNVEQVLTPQAVVPSHISLTQYSGDFYGKSPPLPTTDIDAYHPGQRWQLTVRLKRPHGGANPHGFDFEAWALERNIRATGSIREQPDNLILKTFVWHPGYMVEVVREKIRDRMAAELDHKPYAGILQALAIGDESGIQQDDWQMFVRTGTIHLMSISGLHITMLAGLAFGLVYALWRRVELLTLRLPARKAATLAGLLAALLYALIAGFSVPTQRTFYMLAVFAAALWSGRHIAISHVLACAVLLVVALDPWAVLAPGFWLSFGAVAVIAYAVSGRLHRPHWLQEAVHTQWAVTLGLLPLLLVLFQQVSLISPIANAFAIPLVSLVVVPLTLAGALLPLDWPLQFAHAIMSFCIQVLQWLGSLPFSTWQQHAPPVWTLPLALLGVLWMLLPRGIPLRWLGLAAFLPMFMLQPLHPEYGAMKVAVLDVGQGLSVVLQTATHTLLYDAGPRYSSQSDSGNRIVIPFLRGQGIDRLNGFVVSHNDSDHRGGMVSVLTQMPVDWVASSLGDDDPDLAARRHMRCYAGQSWEWDGVHFEMLYPGWDSYADSAIKDNNRSCVLRVTSKFGSLLIPGDIERGAEAMLLKTYPEKLATDVLIAPHHGSKTSSSPGFVAATKPAVVIFTMGYLNRFNHPKQAVVERYKQNGSHIYRSDNDGAILLDFADSKAIAITRWRYSQMRYWQDLNMPKLDMLEPKTK